MKKLLFVVSIPWGLAFLVCASALVLRSHSSPKPDLLVEPPFVDLGRFELADLGRDVAGSFKLHNRGASARQINHIGASCGCFVELRPEGSTGTAKPNAIAIAPGQSRAISFRLHPKPAAGEQIETLTVSSDDPARPVQHVRVRVEVFATLIAAPAKLALGEAPAGTRFVKDVELIKLGTPFDTTLSHVQVSNPELIEAKLNAPPASVAAGAFADYRRVLAVLSIRMRLPTTPGKVEGSVSVFKLGDTRPVVTIPVIAAVASPVQVTPKYLVFAGQPGEAVEQSVRCVGGAGAKLDVGVLSVGDSWHCEVMQGPTLSEKRVKLRRKLPSSGGLSREQLRLRCVVDSKPLEIMLIPVALHVRTAATRTRAN